jgi:hypothetical protein
MKDERLEFEKLASRLRNIEAIHENEISWLVRRLSLMRGRYASDANLSAYLSLPRIGGRRCGESDLFPTG